MKHVKKMNEEWGFRDVVDDFASVISRHEEGTAPNNPSGKLENVAKDLESFRETGNPSLDSIIQRIRGLADDFSGSRD